MLVFIIIFLGAFILIKRINKYVDKLEENNQSLSDEEFERRLVNLDKHEVDEILKLRQQGFKEGQSELESTKVSTKYSGLIKNIINPKNPLFDEKSRSHYKIEISKELKEIIIWYLGEALMERS